MRRWKVVLVVALTLGIVYAGDLRAEPGPRAITPLYDTEEAVGLLVAEGGQTQADRLVPLDPLTLADLADGSSIALGVPAWSAVLSADGSTLVMLDFERTTRNPQPSEVTITVRDIATGAQRATYDLPLTVGGPGARLSQDGSLLVLAAMPGLELGTTSPQRPPEWHVVETATGTILATVPADPDGKWSAETWIDPDAHRLYRLQLPDWLDNPGPGSALIVAHDLTTGVEIGRLEVTEVRSGTWDTGRTIPHPTAGTLMAPLAVIGELRPGAALSPDGRWLALVHADADKVTMIDAERLVVERTVAFAPEASLGDRLLAFVPLVPQGAAAKLPTDGTRVSAVFAADGRHLYISGDETSTSADGTSSRGNLPLRLIDTERGGVVAETAGDGFYEFKPAADGRSLYAIASGPDEAGADDEPPMVLRRLNALTLEVEAERIFASYPRILLHPAVPNGSDQHIV